MYLAERPRSRSGASVELRSGRVRPVSSTVWALGAVSLLTDISSESVAAVLPVYLTVVLGLSPLAYGLIDGLYQGVSGLVRILGGYVADLADRPKWVAAAGYGLSAVTKLFLLTFSGLASITAIITLDRIGKGVRTGPRDALIAASAPAGSLDTAGAAIGPLLAFTVRWMLPGDYTSVFVVSCAAAALGLVVLGLLVPDLRPRAAVGGTAVSPRPSVSAMREHGMGRLLVVGGLLSLLAISDGFLYLTLLERDRLAATYFPLLFVGTNVAYLLLAVPFGRLADRVGHARVLVGGHLLLVAAYLSAVGPASGATLTLLCLSCLGAYYASTDGVLAALTASMLPVHVRAVGIATTQTVVVVARFGSSLLFGAAWTTWGRDAAVLGFAVALLLTIPVAGWLMRGAPTAPTAPTVPGPS